MRIQSTATMTKPRSEEAIAAHRDARVIADLPALWPFAANFLGNFLEDLLGNFLGNFLEDYWERLVCRRSRRPPARSRLARGPGHEPALPSKSKGFARSPRHAPSI